MIGCGRWGKNILRDLRALGCEVPVVATHETSIANATEGGASEIVSAADQLPPVDGAVIATRTLEHAAAIEAFAAAQPSPIFCEKPLCADADQADDLAERFGDRLFVMDKWRYHPAVREVARIARDGELGAPRSLQMRRVTTRNPHGDVDTVWTHAPHDVAIALEIFGDLPPARFAVEERTADGRIGLTATLGGPPWVNIEISDAAPGHRRELRLVCENGSMQLDGGWAEQITIRRPGADDDEVRATPGELPLLAELRAFAEHLTGGPPPLSSAADAALQVRRIEELIALAESNERVTA
ncbi:MAG: Gfo/Idh/MocA family oxidoreductase [Solirubrobacterales bacterium]